MKIQKLKHDNVQSAAILLKQDWLLHAENTRSYDSRLISKRDVSTWLDSRVFKEKTFYCLVALQNTAVVAVLLYRVIDCISIAPRDKAIKIEDIVVGEKHRGNGVAKELLAEIEVIARELGIFQIEGDVYTFNEPSKSLFTSRGYNAEFTNYMKLINSTGNSHDASPPSVSKAKLYADGASRGNPGPSSGGYAILDMADNVVKKNGKYLGITTNNQAEYHSLKGGLEMAIQMGIRDLDVYMDSLLVVNQMKGIYKIRNRDLWPIHDAIKSLLPKFKKINFTHIPRELNKLADAVANEALDAQNS